ncbi:MAG TPA: antibiotic biosynthesis monooxygenase [Terriglobales bacterium]|nr:antibiotic biosynthesis monooxygenase [Terriglobales bacterium]
MIARVWRGWAAPAGAGAYERYFRGTLSPELLGIPGCAGAHLLRRPDGDEVELSTIVWFESLDAVRRFAGADAERAVVSEHAQGLLTRYEHRVVHYEVAATAGA